MKPNQTLLNIGLARSGRKDLNSLEVVNFLEEATDQSIIDYSVQTSNTERTLVVLLPTEKAPDEFLHALSVVLGQECIAAVDASSGGLAGRLCGPDAAKWAPFNPDFFLTLNGGTL